MKKAIILEMFFRDNWTWDVIVNEFGTSSMDGINATFNIDGTVDVISENSTKI